MITANGRHHPRDGGALQRIAGPVRHHHEEGDDVAFPAIVASNSIFATSAGTPFL